MESGLHISEEFFFTLPHADGHCTFKVQRFPQLKMQGSLPYLSLANIFKKLLLFFFLVMTSASFNLVVTSCFLTIKTVIAFPRANYDTFSCLMHDYSLNFSLLVQVGAN